MRYYLFDLAHPLGYTWNKVVKSGGKWMFYGEFDHSIDEKNRVIIPSRFRDALSDSGNDKLFITRGFEECLFVFTELEWKNQEAKFKALPFTKKEVRRFKRIFFSGAMDVEPDKQWRVLIPDYLKEYALITKDVKIVGVSNHFEIWDLKKWNEFYASSRENYEDIAEDLFSGE
jgi:MraZ protein